MPNGYTYGVQNGKFKTLEDYAKACARAFCWQARDSDEEDLVKLVTPKDDISFYEQIYNETEREYNDFLNMTDADWVEYITNTNQEKLDNYNKFVIKMKEEEARYDAMIEKVIAWNPPTDKHTNLKKFMLDQLRDSKKFDCFKLEPPTLIPLDDMHYRKGQIEMIKERLDRAKKDLEKFKVRDSEGIEWVNQLLESIKGK